jgi:hypothetical protein
MLASPPSLDADFFIFVLIANIYLCNQFKFSDGSTLGVISHPETRLTRGVDRITNSFFLRVSLWDLVPSPSYYLYLLGARGKPAP